MRLLIYSLLLHSLQAHQITWSQFVKLFNVHEKVGHNVSCDLHMEYLNRVCKMAVHSLGANLTSKAVVRV